MTNPVDIANRALAEIGTRSQLVGSTIDPAQSTEAKYAALLYAPLRDFLLREGDYDWSAQLATLTGGTSSGSPWSFSYDYPSGALRIRQLLPNSYDATDPRPVVWNVANVSGARRIMTLEAMVSVIYTFAPVEDVWDAIFTEAYIRLLGSSLTFALENRIEASQVKLNEAISFAGIANLRDA